MKREETVDYHIKSSMATPFQRMYTNKAALEDFTTAVGFVLIKY